MKKVGYLGPEGTFSQEAGKVYLKKLEGKADLLPYSTIHDLLSAVDREEIDEGIAPIENSIEGTIGLVYDMLAKEVDLKIKNEIILPVHHALMAKKNVELKDIKEIISHPQPIEQCRGWIRKHLPKAKVSLAYSTSEAAKLVAFSDRQDIASAGPEGIAKLYDLKILVKDIADYKDNATRFIVVAKADHKATGQDKTSIVFSAIADRPGGLHTILSEFATRNINLTKIESRPSKKALGDYYFFIDMEGHRQDKEIHEALSDIMNKVSFIKVLGSYPKGDK